MFTQFMFLCFFFSSRRRHTRCALVTGVRRVLFRSPGAKRPPSSCPRAAQDTRAVRAEAASQGTCPRLILPPCYTPTRQCVWRRNEVHSLGSRSLAVALVSRRLCAMNHIVARDKIGRAHV